MRYLHTYEILRQRTDRVQLFNKSVEQAWIKHSAGSIALIKNRGAMNYHTDFEKALLLSQIGRIVGVTTRGRLEQSVPSELIMNSFMHLWILVNDVFWIMNLG